MIVLMSNQPTIFLFRTRNSCDELNLSSVLPPSDATANASLHRNERNSFSDLKEISPMQTMKTV
jgi:hypothetical protein